ncbi:MAG TPA: phosphoenolpyruvate--protein phosphotransferase [Vicinamibacterales bacterium]|nr:phosphoenolpyruvate--protein phosphotransferase [Vicinamibacterales bacterium]
MERLTGIPVSPGVVVGRAVVLTGHADVVRFPIPPDRVADELESLDLARERSHTQLHEIRDRLAQGPGRDLAPLFDAQLLILDDSMFLGRARAIIRDERVNAAWAVHRAYEELCAVFATVEDPYLREGDSDLADVAGRVRMNLRRAGGWTSALLHEVDGPAVLVADELTASLAAQMDWSRVLGFATDAGGRTHHTAILARSLKVPAVVGLRDFSRRVRPGTPVIIDGTTGIVTVDPSPAQIEDARRQAPAPRRRAAGVPGPPEPAVTADGVAVRLDANLERLEEVPALIEAGAAGVGLFRTEFLLAGRAADALSEDQQVEIYRDLLASLAPRPVTIRTFDLDQRQPGPWSSRDRRDGRPGLRGVRLGLARPEVLTTQLRALLRAAPAGYLRVMFPFVTSVEEMRGATALMRAAADRIGYAGVPVSIGAMVEVPSAALAADLLARESAFFTVGTNDLIQYALAVDRTDERLSDLYQPLHPAVLRLLRLVRRAAHHQHIDASVCGEMASDPALIGLLVGLGFRAFSMTPSAIPVARRIVQELRIPDARRLASAALRLATAGEVEQHLLDALAVVDRRSAPR